MRYKCVAHKPVDFILTAEDQRFFSKEFSVVLSVDSSHRPLVFFVPPSLSSFDSNGHGPEVSCL